MTTNQNSRGRHAIGCQGGRRAAEVGCSGAGLHRAEYSVSLGADEAGGAGSAVTVSEGAAGQPGRQVRVGGGVLRGGDGWQGHGASGRCCRPS